MSILSDEQQKLITYRQQAGKEALKIAELLLQNNAFSAAVQRFYIAIFQYGAAFLASREKEVSSIEDVFEQLRHWQGAELEMDERSKLDALENLAADADLRPFFELTDEQIVQHKTTAIELIAHLNEYIDEVLDSKQTSDEVELTDEAVIDQNATKARPILVPWDFTELAHHALAHAVRVAKDAKAPICLLHIVKKSSQLLEAETKIKELTKEQEAETGIAFSSVVKIGNIFTDISEEANDRDALMVVMGTHGIKGMQKLTGSWALKVIADTKAPFMVIQDKVTKEKVTDIVFPVTHVRDIKKMLNEVLLLHELYQPTFHLIRLEKYASESFRKQAVTNFVFVKSFLKHNGVKYVEEVYSGSKNYYTAALNYGKGINTDLIFVLTTKDINSLDYVMGAEEQRLIANDEKIPVLCVNPKQAKSYSIGAIGAY